MNVFTILIIGSLLFISNKMSAQSENIMQKYDGKNRILLIFSSSEKGEMYEKQISLLAKDENGLSERAIVIFQIFDGKGFAPNQQSLNKDFCEKLREEFAVKKEKFCIILIGKDGGEKYRKTTVLTTEELFAIIDAMPMRQAEMKKKKY